MTAGAVLACCLCLALGLALGALTRRHSVPRARPLARTLAEAIRVPVPVKLTEVGGRGVRERYHALCLPLVKALARRVAMGLGRPWQDDEKTIDDMLRACSDMAARAWAEGVRDMASSTMVASPMPKRLTVETVKRALDISRRGADNEPDVAEARAAALRELARK